MFSCRSFWLCACSWVWEDGEGLSVCKGMHIHPGIDHVVCFNIFYPLVSPHSYFAVFHVWLGWNFARWMRGGRKISWGHIIQRNLLLRMKAVKRKALCGFLHVHVASGDFLSTVLGAAKFCVSIVKVQWLIKSNSATAILLSAHTVFLCTTTVESGD